MRAATAAVAAGLALVGAPAGSSELRPPYVTRAIPLYGVPAASQPGVWTSRGDYVVAMFDFVGAASVQRLPYRVCAVTRTAQRCVNRVWKGRPDLWMIRVVGDLAAGSSFEFRWHSRGALRGHERVTIYE
jgi:hypothetical protein